MTIGQDPGHVTLTTRRLYIFLCACADGYGSTDVIYWWTYASETGRSIMMASDMTLSQFDLIRFPHGNETQFQPHRGQSAPLLPPLRIDRRPVDSWTRRAGTDRRTDRPTLYY
jgi:hypothetical protein